MRAISLAIALAWLISANAQDFGLRGPISGFLFDQPSQAIRPILGLLGGAHLGAPMIGGIEFGSISPDGQRALIVQGGDIFLVNGLGSPELALTRVDEAISSVDRVLWSSDSQASVICSSETSMLQRVGNFSGMPTVVSPPVRLSAVGGRVTVLATDVGCRNIVAGVAGEGFYLWPEDRDPILLMQVLQPSAGVFTENGRDLYAADRVAGVFLVQNIAPGATATLVLGPVDGDLDAVGLATSGDRLYVASSATRKVRVYQMPNRALAGEVLLDVEPSGMEAIPQSSYFVVSRRRKAGDLIILLDVRAGLRTFFVPPGE